MKKYAVLIEDDIYMLDTLSEFLQRQGFEPWGFSDPRAALEHVEGLSDDQRANIEIFITDYALPHLSGIDFIRQVRKSFQMTPIILISAVLTADQQVLAQQEGAFAFLAKPFPLAELKEIIRSTRGRSRSA